MQLIECVGLDSQLQDKLDELRKQKAAVQKRKEASSVGCARASNLLLWTLTKTHAAEGGQEGPSDRSCNCTGKRYQPHASIRES